MIILTDYGVNYIMGAVQWYLNKNTLLSNYDDDQIRQKMEDLAKKGIGVRPLWYPAHRMPLYQKECHFCGHLSEDIYNSTICLPSSVGLTDGEIQRVVEEISQI